MDRTTRRRAHVARLTAALQREQDALAKRIAARIARGGRPVDIAGDCTSLEISSARVQREYRALIRDYRGHGLRRSEGAWSPLPTLALALVAA